MRVILILVGTGQNFGVNRFLQRLKAGIRMLMLQDLYRSAYKIACIIKTIRIMFMQNYFCPIADKLRFGS